MLSARPIDEEADHAGVADRTARREHGKLLPFLRLAVNPAAELEDFMVGLQLGRKLFEFLVGREVIAEIEPA